MMNELDIFSAALDLTDPAERLRFLDEACGDSPELRQRIDALLSNALRAGLVKRSEDCRWGSLWRWLQKPEPEPEPKLLSPWPIPRLPNWVERANDPLS